MGDDGQQLGILSLADALNLARSRGVDLVEVAPNANPPVCRIVDFGKYKYEQEKRQKENRKHHHASKVKEIQLSATIDPHDFQTKLSHAIDFLCEEMKVKAALRFRGREMAHTEFGFQVVQRFLREIAPWGHPDFQPKLTGRSINVMISPLPRNKRAPHPSEGQQDPGTQEGASKPIVEVPVPNAQSSESGGGAQRPASDPANGQSQRAKPAAGFSNNPFEGLNVNPGSGSR